MCVLLWYSINVLILALPYKGQIMVDTIIINAECAANNAITAIIELAACCHGVTARHIGDTWDAYAVEGQTAQASLAIRCAGFTPSRLAAWLGKYGQECAVVACATDSADGFFIFADGSLRSTWRGNAFDGGLVVRV